MPHCNSAQECCVAVACSMCVLWRAAGTRNSVVHKNETPSENKRCATLGDVRHLEAKRSERTASQSDRVTPCLRVKKAIPGSGAENRNQNTRTGNEKPRRLAVTSRRRAPFSTTKRINPSISGRGLHSDRPSRGKMRPVKTPVSIKKVVFACIRHDVGAQATQ